MSALSRNKDSESGFSIVQVSYDQFSSMAEEWARLLSRSDADPLFMSWPWLFTWWETWAETMGLELVLIAVYDCNNELVGIGPFYRRVLKTPVGLKIKRLYFIGNAWRIAPTVRSEYCGLILDKSKSEQAGNCIFSYLKGLDWDEIIFCDFVKPNLRLLEESIQKIFAPVRSIIRVKEPGVRLDVRGDFSEWLKKLGSNTRLKLFNRRRYLEQKGSLLHESWLENGSFTSFLERLNAFHRERWGKDAFGDLACQFHENLLHRLKQGGMKPICSILKFNDDVVSLIYDIEAGGTRYNLQSGYYMDFDAKISLGTLHFGYAVEEAFGNSAIEGYDFLAGSGKNSFYKRQFKGEEINFYTGQIARTKLLREAYCLQQRMPIRLKRVLNKFMKL